MPELIYPWKRFWYPRGEQPNLQDEGFLVDPDSEYAKYLVNNLFSFDSIQDAACLVLLGEPGIGKTKALENEFERVKSAVATSGDTALWFDLRDYSSDERLERKVFECDAVKHWVKSQNTFHLFLDSLDEGLLLIANIYRVLLSGLEHLPPDRLRLRIASRPVEWQMELENGFLKKWGTDNVKVLELAPLRKKDVADAASLSGLDPDKFLNAIKAAEVAPLAIKPVTLNFLKGVYSPDKVLPATRIDLYFGGCKRLCEEPNEHRRDSLRGRESLTPIQKLRIAARIAAISQFSNRSAIWMDLEDGLEPEDVSIESIVGTEGEVGSEITVDSRATHEVLGAGLFSSRALHRQGWRHQSYAEYLAAYYLDVRKVPSTQLKALILHPDGSGKVVPQLRETAAWLAAMNSEFFDLLVRRDPEVLLRSDAAFMADTDRAIVAERLLEAFETGGITQSLWETRQDFGRLSSPGLEKIVRPYVSDVSHSQEARIAAIEFVRECRIESLYPQIASIALETSETDPVRTHAAATIAEVGDEPSRKALRPLALGEIEDDPNDELKGYALSATWPEHITACELFAALTPIRNSGFFGMYRRFLESRVAEQLKPADIETAVSWASQRVRGRDEFDAVHHLASDILVRSVDYIDRPMVLDLLAAALFERRRVYTDCEHVTSRMRAVGDDARRAVAAKMFPAAVYDNLGPFAVIDVCALEARDVPWLLAQLSQVTETRVRRVIGEIIGWRLDPFDVETFGTVLNVSSNDQDLAAAIGPMMAAVMLDSPRAAEQRTHHALLVEHRQPGPPTASVPIAESLAEIFAKHESDDTFFRVYLLFRDRKPASATANEPFKGWSELSEDVKIQIHHAAHEYVRTRPPTPEGKWWEEGRFTMGMFAGYFALHFIALRSPDSLDQISDEDWRFWTTVILAYLPDQHEASTRPILLAKALGRARTVFLPVLEEIIRGENARHGRVFVLSKVDGLWDEGLAALLGTILRSDVLQPGSFRDVLAKLLSKQDAEALEIAHSIALGPIPQDQEGRRRMVFSTAELLSQRPGDWSMIWPVFQNNEEFGTEVLKLVAYEHQFNSFANRIREKEIADICIWVSKLGLDQAADNESGLVTSERALAHWWNALVNSLMYKGTTAACDALRRMIRELPQYGVGLRHSLREAEDLARRKTWRPPSPAEVIELVSKSSKRLVRNGRELLEVLIESLSRLQDQLQGITQSSGDLWDEVVPPRNPRVFWPKKETTFSDWVKRHLDRDLRERGVILNREVEIRAPMGGKKGEKPDIWVDISVPVKHSHEHERISAVIEAKGCWNDDLRVAMETQLADRYMAENEVHYGIYLVGWFMCSQWDQADPRRAATPGLSIDQARRQFDEQAGALSDDGRLIRSVVLNAALH